MEGRELEKERKALKAKKANILFSNDDKVEVDQKLEQFLSIHSMNLSIGVRQYLEKSKQRKLTDEEAVSNLGLIAFERKKFLASLKAVEIKCRRRIGHVKLLAKDKARQGMDLIIKQCNRLFRMEWGHIVAQYNEMRDALYTAE